MISKEILSQVRRIELTSRRLMNTALSGGYHSRFKGKGMEFAQVREYAMGDDVRSIDWNVTARSHTPHVKQFNEERELNLMLVVDCSASTLFGSKHSIKRETMAMVASLLAFIAIKNQDQVGLLLFSDHLEKMVPPAKGRKHVLRMVRDLLEFEPQGLGTEVHHAIDGLEKNLKKNSIVIFLSDFLQMPNLEDFKHLNRKHEVIALQIWDLFEGELPYLGKLPVQDLETGEVEWLNTGGFGFMKRLFKKEEKRQADLKSTFKTMGVDFVKLTQKKQFSETISPLIQYFNKKSRGSK